MSHVAATAEIASPSRPRGGLGSRLAWAGVTGAFVTLAWLVALLARRDFFYFDDTPGGAVGQWYELGQQLAGGTWPLLNLEAWMAGNYSLEQWGLFNPPTLLIALLAPHAGDLELFTSLVKLAFLLVGAWGVQYLARTMGTSAPWAAIAGASAAVAGLTFFLDATAWVTQLMVWAWFGWAMAGLLRWAHDATHLVLGLVAGAFVITVGYVHGTLFLVLWFVALLGHALMDRAWPRLLRVLASGAVLGLVAVAVYLPALLTSSVTVRASGIDNDGFMVLTGNGLLLAATPLASPDLSGWWGRYAHLPLTYVAWFLPLVVLVGAREIGRRVRPWLSVALFGGLLLVMAMGPSQLAMFRFPIRAMPWIALVLIVLAVRALDGLGHERRATGGATAALLLVGFAGWLGYSANPFQGRWLLPMTLMLLAATWVACRVARGRVPAFARRVGLAAVVGLVSVGVTLGQILVVAQRSPGFGRGGFPADAAVLHDALPGGHGDALVVGDPWKLPEAERWAQTSTGNLWYLVDNADVMNLYSPSGFAAFNNDLCMNAYYGATCPELLPRLFEPDPATGAPLADLLSLDTIQVLAVPGQRPLADLTPPAGWRVAHTGDASVTWVRDNLTAGVAEGYWASPGLSLTPVDEDDMGVTLRVDAAGADGGTVVLPRLAWPGYSATGAATVEPLRGYLVTLAVPPGTPAGTEIQLTYRPPGFGLQLGALAGGVLVGVALIAGTWWARRRGLPTRFARAETSA